MSAARKTIADFARHLEKDFGKEYLEPAPGETGLASVRLTGYCIYIQTNTDETMRLFIAEKPSLARAIADALPGAQKKGNGCITVGEDVVSWCVGHLLEQAEPEAYNPAFKKWSHDHLPIVPEQWQWVPKKQTQSQLTVLRKLVSQADELVHAGDPDREGQLLVDEVFEYLKVSQARRKNIQRCLISDLNRTAVQRSLANLRANADFQPLSVSALARARADWLYGINLTRAFTLQGREAGYQGVLSVGRVQTPVLGLVVRRDEQIEQFVSQPYYEVWAELETEDGAKFKAKWDPSEACEPWLDEQRRNLSRPLADNVVQRVSFQPGEVTEFERKKTRQAAPLPHSLSSLQMEANRVFGLSAQRVLDLCQQLYETHKAITYPRSDSRHLPTEHFREAPRVVKAIKASLANLDESGAEAAWAELDTQRKSKAWNDSKVEAHHAIIPTERVLSRLDVEERKVYWLVCRQYLAQFMPPWVRSETRVAVTIANGLFRASANETLEDGWKCLFPVRRQNPDDTDPSGPLPVMTKGQPLQSLQAETVEKHTTPPKHFTEATLLAAMTGIARFVEDTALKTVLKETDGLGTEATRAGILELLFKRGFLKREGKAIRATPTGQVLINALPRNLTLPDRTARWESILGDIAGKRARYEHLMTPLIAELQELSQAVRQIIPRGLSGLSAPTTRWGGKRKPATKAKPRRRKPAARKA